MSREWRYSPHDESRIRDLSRDLGVAPLTAQVLIARGFETAEPAREFLGARLSDLERPEVLAGAAEAADRVVAAIRAGRKITIYGDYDVDGVTATAILWHCLRLAGANVEYYIPCRLEEGYGLNCDALRQLHQDDPQQLVITVDCGIASVREAALARELGLELIISDHHEFASELPPAACLVHPRLPGKEAPFGDLCGAGVALKLAWAISAVLNDGRRASPRMRSYLTAAVGLAAIGTVADVVPLRGENRVIVRYGLASLAEQSGPGLQALMAVSKIEQGATLDAEDIGFALAPRINAAGRLGQARLAVELLTTDDVERAKRLAEWLDELNRNRRTVERRIFKDAKEKLAEQGDADEAGAVVLASADWHPGVIGIVASRVAEYCEKPTVLIALNAAEGVGRGSARTWGGFDLHAGLTGCADLLESCGGHQAAAGLKIQAGKLDEFREAFSRYVLENPAGLEEGGELTVDAEVRLADCTRRAVLELDRLGPFGCENPRPLFAAMNCELAEPPRTMGEGDRHLSLQLRQFGTRMRAVAFGRGEWAEEIARADGPIAVTFAPGINRFRGYEKVELQLKDWQPQSAMAGTGSP